MSLHLGSWVSSTLLRYSCMEGIGSSDESSLMNDRRRCSCSCSCSCHDCIVCEYTHYISRGEMELQRGVLFCRGYFPWIWTADLCTLTRAHQWAILLTCLLQFAANRNRIRGVNKLTDKRMTSACCCSDHGSPTPVCLIWASGCKSQDINTGNPFIIQLPVFLVIY